MPVEVRGHLAGVVLLLHHYVGLFMRQGFTTAKLAPILYVIKMTLNSSYFCVYILRSGNTGMGHHARVMQYW